MDTDIRMREASMVDEETLTAELSQLGIRYLAHSTTSSASKPRPPSVLLAELMRQPSARMRAAVIPVLLARPEFASSVADALRLLAPPERVMLRFYYTAAYLLQQQHAGALKRAAPSSPAQLAVWAPLPDLFSEQIGLPSGGTPRERLRLLGLICQRETGAMVNWAGTFEHAAQQLLRRWEVEAGWTT